MNTQKIYDIVFKYLDDYPDKTIAVQHIAEFIKGRERINGRGWLKKIWPFSRTAEVEPK
jgi:hypothetical protein